MQARSIGLKYSSRRKNTIGWRRREENQGVVVQFCKDSVLIHQSTLVITPLADMQSPLVISFKVRLRTEFFDEFQHSSLCFSGTAIATFLIHY